MQMEHAESDEDDVVDLESSDEDEQLPVKKAGARSAGKRAAAVLIDDSDDDENDPAPAKKPAARAALPSSLVCCWLEPQIPPQVILPAHTQPHHGLHQYPASDPVQCSACCWPRVTPTHSHHHLVVS